MDSVALAQGHVPSKTAKSIAAGLDSALQQALAALHNAPQAVAELALATQRFGTRSLYAGLGILAIESAEDEERLTLTPLGAEVIAICAEMCPELDQDVDSAVRRLRSRLHHPEQAGRLTVKRA